MQVAANCIDLQLESRDDTVTTANDAFEAFKEDIRSIIDGYTNLEIIEEVKVKGFHTSLTALKYQLQDWGLPASV